MATKNEIEFKVRVTDEGLAPLASRLDAVDKKTDELGKSAGTTGKQIDGMGREESLAPLASKIDAADKKTDELGKSAGNTGRQIDGMGDAADQAGKQTDELGGSAASASTLLGNMAASLAAAFTVTELVAAAAQMEQVQAGLRAVSGDATQAAEQMDFVRRMASAAGVDVVAAGQAFLGLAAATKGTAVEGEPARAVFEAVTLAMAKAGKSSAETQNALLALQQIASKGTVSMEELRGQLGEALPGALQAASAGLGITTQDLIKLVESGQLAAEDLFPALASGLNELYGGAPAAQTLSQEITNIKNAFVEMAANLGESGGLDALKVGAEVAQMAITILGNALIQTGQLAGVLMGALTTLDFSGLTQAFADIEAQGRERLLKAAEHNEVLRNSLRLTAGDAIQAALAAREQGQAAADAGAQNAAAAPGVAALGVAYAKVREEVAAQIGMAEKEIEAVKARGQAAVALAAGLGDEAAQRQAISQAAASEAAAMDALAQQREIELNVLKAELAARQALMAQSGADSVQRNKEVAELERLIQVKQIDADKTRAQAAAAQEKARANSEEVLAAQAATSAAQALAVARSADERAALSGLNVQRELARQSEAMARLMGDEAGVRAAKIAQLKIEIEITHAKVQVARAEAEGSISVAQAKLAELSASGQLTALKEAEINASIRLAQAKLAEAEAAGKGSALLARQIELLTRGAGAAGGYGSQIDGLAGSQAGLAGATGQANAELQRQMELINRRYSRPGEGSEDPKDPGRGSPYSRPQDKKPVNADGQTQDEYLRMKRLAGQNAVDNTLMFELEEKLRRGALTRADEADIRNVIAALDQNDAIDRSVDRMNPAGFSLEGMRDRSKWRAVRGRLADTLQGFGGGGPGIDAGGSEAARPIGGPSTTHNVNVTIGGRTTTVNAASANDAATLAGVLRELERAAGRA